LTTRRKEHWARATVEVTTELGGKNEVPNEVSGGWCISIDASEGDARKMDESHVPSEDDAHTNAGGELEGDGRTNGR
jgi:hypothetical protein